MPCITLVILYVHFPFASELIILSFTFILVYICTFVVKLRANKLYIYIDILFFNSDYFDSILKNCTDRIFSHVPHYFCGQVPKIFTM